MVCLIESRKKRFVANAIKKLENLRESRLRPTTNCTLGEIMKNKILALIFTTLVALIVFGAAFGFVALMGFDIKPLEGSGRTQGEAMVIGSAFIAIMFIGFINGIRGLFGTFDWFVKEFDKRDNMDLG